MRDIRDPAQRNEAAVKLALADLDKGLSYIEHYLSGNVWAVGDQPSIADCALVPVLNIVSWMASFFGQSALVGQYRKLDAYWQAAKAEVINARVIAEQLAAVPRG